MKNVLTRSVVRPADDITNRNRRVTFKDDVQEKLEKIDPLNNTFKHNKTSKPTDSTNVDEENHSEDDEAEDEDLGIASRTRAKIRGTLHANTVKKSNEKQPNKAITNMLLIPTTIFFILFQLSLWIPTTTSSIIPDVTESSQFRGA